MIELTTSVNFIQQLESSEALYVRNENSERVAQKAENSAYVTDVNQSQQQSSDKVTDILSTEDILVLKRNKAQNIIDSLADIRLKLKDLMQILKDPEMEFDVATLDKMDSMSNSLIESTISIVRKNDDMGIVNFNILNTYLGGLETIKNMNLQDNDYLLKIQTLDSNVKSQVNEYLKASDYLDLELEKTWVKYDKLVDDNNSINVKDIEKQILNSADQTLSSVTANMSSDAVLRVLKH
ncbi:hypothetical protein J6R97_06460 [bacterium]|nr:hypothetical protein [bacterium]